MSSLKELKYLNEYICWIWKDVVPSIKGLALIVLMNSIGSLLAVSMAVASRNIIDSATSGNIQMTLMLGLMFLVIIIVSVTIDSVLPMVSVRVSEAMSNRIRQRFFRKTMGAEWMELSDFHSGDLITRMTSDIGAITNVVVNTLPGICALVVQLLAAFFVLVRYDVRLGLLALVMGPTAVLFGRVWGKRMKQLQKNTQEAESKYRAYIQEALQNLLIIKCFGLELHTQDKLQTLHQNRILWIRKRNNLGISANMFLNIGYWIGYLLAFGWGVYGLSQRTISYGMMIAFVQLVSQVQTPFHGLAATIPQIISSMASMDRLQELERLSDEQADSAQYNDDGALPQGMVGVRMKNVSFWYKDGHIVFDHITAEIMPGEMVALVGPSGVGKTTIVRLILSLVRPSGGVVELVDGRGHGYGISAGTRKMISYVPQGNTLFSGTIADNLCFGKMDATCEEMRQAAMDAAVWSFIESLPDGFDTVIGEKGMGLSEGQAQRLAIARAFLRKAPILVLDEATSALDEATEMHILRALKKNMGNCTCIVITHRKAALKICSRVLRLEEQCLREEPGRAGIGDELPEEAS